MNFVTEEQLANKHNGNNNVVRITKNKDIPSTPNEIFTFANGSHSISTQCWNLAVDWSKPIHKNNEQTKTNELTAKAQNLLNSTLVLGKNAIKIEQTIKLNGKNNNKFGIYYL